MIDAMASRYHKLPSEILATATTTDLYCMDVAMAYERFIQSNNTSATSFDINTLEDAMVKVNNESN
jgi:hypothetical protein